MALRGIKPTKVEKRLKALFFGPAGSGKSTTSLGFPRVYMIDCERGAINDSYVNLLEKNGGSYFPTSDFDDLMKEVKSLLSETHEYKTLVIDPLTIVYNDLLDKSALKVGTEYGRHYGEANKQMKHLLALLLRLDMNVIITSHAKNELGKDLSILGQTYDCYKKLDYLFDLVFEVKKQGKAPIGIVRKTRIESFPDGEAFPFSYSEIAKRYGKAILERDAVPEVLASKEQVIKLKHLVDLYKEPPELVQKWLDKAECQSFDEMREDIISKIIAHLEAKASKGEAL